jgi:hypothetical protein
VRKAFSKTAVLHVVHELPVSQNHRFVGRRFNGSVGLADPLAPDGTAMQRRWEESVISPADSTIARKVKS